MTASGTRLAFCEIGAPVCAGRVRLALHLSLFVLLLAPPAHAQGGRVVAERVHARSLENNLAGDSADRSVLVYLPPGYGKSTQRYPVVYLLHGFGSDHTVWQAEERDLAAIFDRLLATGAIRGFIVVMPDGSNRFGGSNYTNSVTTGFWEDFITEDVVRFIDGKYRTLAASASRGIAGHSMGGYGALKIAMKHPDVFGAVYGMSPCCLIAEREMESAANWQAVLALKKVDEVAKLPFDPHALAALAASYSPNPQKPLLGDLPVELVDGQLREVPPVRDRWIANQVVPFTDQYVSSWRRLRAIAFDVGRQDSFEHIRAGTRDLSAAMARNGIEHVFEEFEGTHVNAVGKRLESKVLPFFSEHLRFAASTATQK